MNYAQLANAFSGINEKYLIEACDFSGMSLKFKNARKKKVGVALSVCGCFILCFIAVLHIAGSNVSVNEIESLTVINSETENIANHGGDGNSFTVDGTKGVEIPTELTVSSNLEGKVLFAAGIDFSDPYDPKKKEQNTSALAELMNIAGISKFSSEYGPDDTFPYIDLGDTVITAFSSYFGIETDCVGSITHDSDDSDILDILTKNRYTSALMEYIGLTPESLYIYRENIFMYGEDEKNTEPLSRMTVFKIANYSDRPQQLAFNISTNYLMFKIIENYAENTTVISSVYGYFVSENCIYELKDYLSYNEAVKNISAQEDSFVEDTAVCAVIYKPDIVKGSLIPYYEFRWNNGNEVKNFRIPFTA